MLQDLFVCYLVYVAGEMTVFRRFRVLTGVEGVDQLKGMIRCVQSLAVRPRIVFDDQMAVVTNPHRITGQTGQALDVKQILINAVDGLGFKNDDFTTIRLAEVVGKPVHQKMIP